MSEIRLFFRSVRHTRLSQLFARLQKMFRRQLEQRLRPNLLGYPRWWYWSPPPRREKPVLLTKLLQYSLGRAKLPFEVNLAGTPHTIEQNTDWSVPKLSYGTRLEKLTLHYMEYLLELDPKARTTVVLDWVDRVPPWSTEFWKDDWNSYALSIRVFTWIRILLENGFMLDQGGKEIIEKSLAQQLRFLSRNLETDIGGNHLVRNARALIAGGAYFDGPEGEMFLEQGERLLREILYDQVLPDGVHFELSPAYHLQVVSDLIDCIALLPVERQQDWLEKIESMVRFAVDTTHPDGQTSLFADAGLNMTTPPAVVFQRWVDLGRSVPQASATWVRPEAGYAGLRSEQDLLIYDFGPIGADHLPAHGHGDIFALEWSVGGKRFVVDAGVFEYHPGYWRSLSRATSSHNTVMLDRYDHAEFYGSFRVGSRPKITVNTLTCTSSGFEIDAEHDGYRSLPGNPRVRRRILAKPGKVEVLDEICGGTGQCMESALLLSPDVRVKKTNDCWFLEHLDGPALRLKTDSEVYIEEAIWMPDFGQKIQTLRIWMRHGSAPHIATWSLERI